MRRRRRHDHRRRRRGDRRGRATAVDRRVADAPADERRRRGRRRSTRSSTSSTTSSPTSRRSADDDVFDDEFDDRRLLRRRLRRLLRRRRLRRRRLLPTERRRPRPPGVPTSRSCPRGDHAATTPTDRRPRAAGRDDRRPRRATIDDHDVELDDDDHVDDDRRRRRRAAPTVGVADSVVLLAGRRRLAGSTVTVFGRTSAPCRRERRAGRATRPLADGAHASVAASPGRRRRRADRAPTIGTRTGGTDDRSPAVAWRADATTTSIGTGADGATVWPAARRRSTSTRRRWRTDVHADAGDQDVRTARRRARSASRRHATCRRGVDGRRSPPSTTGADSATRASDAEPSSTWLARRSTARCASVGGVGLATLRRGDARRWSCDGSGPTTTRLHGPAGVGWRRSDRANVIASTDRGGVGPTATAARRCATGTDGRGWRRSARRRASWAPDGRTDVVRRRRPT